MSHPLLPITVFLSGGGRSLENLIDAQKRGELAVDFRLVISSSATVRGVQIAREAGIETLVINKKAHPAPDDYSQAMFQPCRDNASELVVMAGYLKHVLIPQDFENRVLNIHPSLLPSFGGPGMYGHHVHQAAIEKGVKVSGCTVHYVDNHYDNGPILHQRSCPVLPGDNADLLAKRVFEQECLALPEAIQLHYAKWIASQPA